MYLHKSTPTASTKSADAINRIIFWLSRLLFIACVASRPSTWSIEMEGKEDKEGRRDWLLLSQCWLFPFQLWPQYGESTTCSTDRFSVADGTRRCVEMKDFIFEHVNRKSPISSDGFGINLRAPNPIALDKDKIDDAMKPPSRSRIRSLWGSPLTRKTRKCGDSYERLCKILSGMNNRHFIYFVAEIGRKAEKLLAIKIPN